MLCSVVCWARRAAAEKINVKITDAVRHQMDSRQGAVCQRATSNAIKKNESFICSQNDVGKANPPSRQLVSFIVNRCSKLVSADRELKCPFRSCSEASFSAAFINRWGQIIPKPWHPLPCFVWSFSVSSYESWRITESHKNQDGVRSFSSCKM